MFYVHASPAKGTVRAYLEAPLVFLAVLYFHPRNGLLYAYRWARQSIVSRGI